MIYSFKLKNNGIYSLQYLTEKKKTFTQRWNRVISCLTLTCILLFMLVLLSNPASAANYFVSTEGNNSNLGTLDNPWKNISYAANKAVSGDTIYLINGTWTDEHVIFTNSGTKDKPIKLVKYNGTVILDGLDKTGNGIYARNKSNITIDGICLKNYQIGMKFDWQTSDLELSNFTISDVNQSGIEFTGNYYSSVFNVKIHDFNISRYGGQKTGVRGGILHEYGFKNSHDIEIYNFDIRDANYGGGGIKIRSTNFLHIHNGSVYNTSMEGQIGIILGQSVSNSIIENVTVNNTGWSGISCYAGGYDVATPEDYLYNNTIKNCVIGYPHHNAIDLHTGNVNPIIENVTLYGDPTGLQGINYMWNGTGLIVRQANITGLLTGMYLTQPNASVWDCTIHNVSRSPIYITKPNININNCNFSTNELMPIFWIGNEADNYIINNTRMGEGSTVRVSVGSGTLRDMLDSEYKISGNNASVTIEYTDGKVFSVTQSQYVSNPLWTPNRSYTNFNSPVIATLIKVTSYSMTVKPDREPVTVNVSKFDTSLSTGDILVNFTVNSPDNNSVLLNIGGLKAGSYYLIKENGVKFASLKANSSGQIEFENSEWPTEWSNHSFTVEEDPSIMDTMPTADAGPDIEAFTNSEVFFNGSKSTDARGIVTYVWDFDSSDGIQIDAIGATASHIYITPGTYEATLTVTNEDGNVDFDTVNIVAKVPEGISGPVITCFSPSEEGCLYINKNITFKINTDQPLSEMNWYLDGNHVSTNSKSFNWTVEEGTHSIKFKGSNKNGSVDKTWLIVIYQKMQVI